MHLVQGIMAALLMREKTGQGQKVGVSLYDSMIAMQMQEAAQWSKHGERFSTGPRCR
jgi:crotonobetainyl-CoA:carnitine CoA-transferase CaiB-like acyl-CoA transferase